jgi:hypothetical protein
MVRLPGPLPLLGALVLNCLVNGYFFISLYGHSEAVTAITASDRVQSVIIHSVSAQMYALMGLCFGMVVLSLVFLYMIVSAGREE